MTSFKSILMVLVLLIFGFSVVPSKAYAMSSPYRIGVGDSLSIIVWNEPNLNQKLIDVLPDGTISFPLVGRIQAVGLTSDELARHISHRLQTVFKNSPNVTVIVRSTEKNHFYIMGAVGHPGMIHFVDNITLLQALIMAGGMQVNAKEDSILVLRNNKPMKISFEKIEQGNNLSNNIPIKSGDIIIVPPKIDQIFIMGEVAMPGPYFFEKDMTVMKALIGAHGFTQFASMGSVKIIRENSDGTKKVIHIDIGKIENEKKINPKEYLKPGDLIYVPQRMF